MDVFINDVSFFLPNEPVSNENIEDVLGVINGVPSRTKNVILRSNKIKTRYYAIDPETKKQTHTNAQLTCEAIKNLKPYTGYTPNDIELISCGSASPDTTLPGLGVMAHGELGTGPCEVVTASGVCLSGVSALKYAYMSVATGNTQNAVATGSELASTTLRADFFHHTRNGEIGNPETNPEVIFNADFLRWMLSDGAGAMYLSNKKNDTSLSLKIEWIELISYAGELNTCMYAGGEQQDDGSIKGYREFSNIGEAMQHNVMAIQQDVKLLNDEIVNVMVDRTLSTIAKKRKLKPGNITWYLPHFSSGYFGQKIHDRMAEIGFAIPMDKWFTNLYTKGNIGSASIYVILEELFHSDKLKIGDKILMMVPESGRFSTAYTLLTVV